MTICFLYVSCSSIPPPPFGGQREFRGRGGRRVQKEAISEGMGGLLTEVFFPGGLSKIGELLINSSFSVEQVISYFAVTGVSKQVLSFALIIFHLYGRLNAFFMAYAIGFFHTVVIGSCINFRLSSC